MLSFNEPSAHRALGVPCECFIFVCGRSLLRVLRTVLCSSRMFEEQWVHCQRRVIWYNDLEVRRHSPSTVIGWDTVSCASPISVDPSIGSFKIEPQDPGLERSGRIACLLFCLIFLPSFPRLLLPSWLTSSWVGPSALVPCEQNKTCRFQPPYLI
jgi:hypothetical protein